MKTIYKYLFILSFMAFASCNVLDQEPEGLISTEDAIVDRQSAIAATNGLYSILQDGDLYGGRFIMATEMVAGNAKATAFQAFWQELASGKVPVSNFHVEDNWIGFYDVINGANAIITQVPELAALSEGEKNEMLGTAYFMRALSFFDLLRQYGEFYNTGSEFGIPLKLTQSLEPSETPRSTVAKSYEQIESDLTKAIDLLGDGNNNFKVSKAAAQALKARVHLYQEEFTEAANLASAVITNSKYDLPENYNEIYEIEESAESIFELNFIQLDDPNVWAIEMYITPPEVSVSAELITFLDGRGENERGALFAQSENNDEIFICTKYGNSQTDNGQNTIILRLSEMYLIRAEALGRNGTPNDALPDLNEIRNRANLPNINNISDDAELLDILLEERRAEFAFEGHYWFDMVRYGLMEDTRGLESFRRIFPIPRREMNITDGTLVQNPGYNQQ